MKLWIAIVAGLCVGCIRLGFFSLGSRFGLTEANEVSISWPILEAAVFGISIASALRATPKSFYAYILWAMVFLACAIATVVSVDYHYSVALVGLIGWIYVTLPLDFVAGLLFVSTFRIAANFRYRSADRAGSETKGDATKGTKEGGGN